MYLSHDVKIKKIALVTDAIYPYNKGGKEKKTFEVSTRLAAKGYDVHIYTMQWWAGKKIKQEHGVTLHAISPLYPLYSGERRSIKEALFFSLACFWLLREDFDIVDVDHMPHLVLFPLRIVTWIKRKKLFVSWNEVWGKEYWVSYMGRMGIIAFIIEKWSAFLPDVVIAISKHTAQRYKSILTNTKKVYTVPCGITIDVFAKILPVEDTVDLIFAGRLLLHKHVDIIVEIVEKLKQKFPDISCLIVGDGPEKEHLLMLIKEKKLTGHIQMHSFYADSNELFSHIKAAKIFVFPSVREGFGLTAIEANACGIPVITTTDKGNATKDLIVEGVNGYSVPLDVDAFSQKIDDLLICPLDTDNIRAIAAHYDWDTIVEELVAIYTS